MKQMEVDNEVAVSMAARRSLKLAGFVTDSTGACQSFKKCLHMSTVHGSV